MLKVLFDISFDIPSEYCMKLLCGCKIFAWKIRLCFEKSFMIIKKPLLAENVLGQGKTLACRKILACGKRIWWSENLSLWETSLMKKKSWLVETFLDERNIYAWGKFSWWRKNRGLWKKISLIKENSLLLENLLDEEKTLVCWKLPWRMEYLCLRKTFLMKEKSWLVENFLDGGKLLACDNFPDKGKISTCAKPPWWSKNIGLLKSSFIVEK